MGQSIVIQMRSNKHPRVKYLNEVESLVGRAHTLTCEFYGYSSPLEYRADHKILVYKLKELFYRI